MIFLDANIFCALTQSPDSRSQCMNDIAADLLRAADRGDIEVTTSDAVIAEVAFILTSRAHYQLAVSDAAGRIATLVRLRRVKLRDKQIVSRALDL